MNGKYIFVYGTLKSGGKNNLLLQGSEFIGRTFLKNHYMFTNGWFPYVLHKRDVDLWKLQHIYKQTQSDDYKVMGEVWRVSDATLGYVRKLEGVPNHYKTDSFEFNIEKYTSDGLTKVDISGVAEFYVASDTHYTEGCKPVYTGYFNVDKNTNVEWRVLLDNQKMRGTAKSIVKKLRSRSFDTETESNQEYMDCVNNRLHKFPINSKMQFEDESHFLNFLASKCIIAEWEKPKNATIRYA